MTMSEKRKTITVGVLALILLALVALTAPRHATPDQFSDLGESFFPDFVDPNAATTLEVVDFDEETAAARPFKVTFKDGQWTIPSHHDYPADGEELLAKTAAGLIGLVKEDFRSSNIADYEPCAVIDPLDEGWAELTGRGKRVTIRDKTDRVLADLIFGRTLEGRSDYRFVRVPDQKRIYVTKANLEVSTQFSDWIEKDLLKVDSNTIHAIILRDYSINERIGTIDQRDTLMLNRREGNEWVANRMSSGQEVDSTKMSALLRAVDELSIVGVRPKPEGLTEDLRRAEGRVPITQENMLSLQAKGYYFTRDGNLVSNEGELEVQTGKGVRYLLRFGELLYGSGETITAGTGESEERQEGPGENRYLFLTASFDRGLIDEPPRPSNTEFQSKPEAEWSDQDRENKEKQDRYAEWEKAVAEGRELAASLNDRFAGWFYVISSESFDKIHLRRSELVVRKSS